MVAVVKGKMRRSGHHVQIMPGALGRRATTNNSVVKVASTQFVMPTTSLASPGAVWRAVLVDRRSLLNQQEGSGNTQVPATGVNLLRPQVLRKSHRHDLVEHRLDADRRQSRRHSNVDHR